MSHQYIGSSTEANITENWTRFFFFFCYFFVKTFRQLFIWGYDGFCGWNVTFRTNKLIIVNTLTQNRSGVKTIHFDVVEMVFFYRSVKFVRTRCSNFHFHFDFLFTYPNVVSRPFLIWDEPCHNLFYYVYYNVMVFFLFLL